MTAEPKYGPWIAHNATPDSTCPPDAVGKRGQFQRACDTRIQVEDSKPVFLDEGWNWSSDVFHGKNIIAYRVLIEPVRGEITALVMDDNIRMTLPTLDGALICGTYTGPDGAVIKVEAV